MKLFTLIPLFALACSSGETAQQTQQVPAFNAEQAQARANEYIQKLFPEGQATVNGPVCMPEPVVDQSTQCSYSLHSGTDWKVGTILCDNIGCREGEAPATVPPDLLPTQTASTTGSGSNGLADDYLFWWMLYNSGGVHTHYSVWYTSTPVMYRTAYYSPHYRPAVESVRYYRTTYAPAVSTSSQRYSTTRSYSPSTTRTTTTRTSTSTSRPTTTTAPKPSYTPRSSTRSSGYGTSTRSSGTRSYSAPRSSGGRR